MFSQKRWELIYTQKSPAPNDTDIYTRGRAGTRRQVVPVFQTAGTNQPVTSVCAQCGCRAVSGCGREQARPPAQGLADENVQCDETTEGSK